MRKISSECQFSYGEDEFGNVFRKFPENSRFIKSEDILYEIKKIQQRQILSDGMEYDYMKNGHSQKEAEDNFQTQEGRNQIEYIEFAQEKYSNGETAMQFLKSICCRMRYICWMNRKYRYHLPIRYYWRKKLTIGTIAFLVSSLLLRIPRLCLEHLMQKSTILIKMIIAFANGMSSKT